MVKDACLKGKIDRGKELEAELLATQGEIICLHAELVFATTVRDRAFTYRYGASILRLRSHLLTNPSHLCTLFYLAPRVF